MYFVPQKKGWYQRAVQVRPLYRYGWTIGLAVALGGGWYFLLNPWLEGAIQYERAAITQLEQKRGEMVHNEHLVQKQAVQAAQLESEINMLIANQKHNQQKQFSTIFDAAKQAGLSISSFTQEKENQKEWRKNSYKQLVATGSFGQCSQFLTALKKSSHMIQCKELSLTRTEGSNYTLQCQLQCVQLT